MSIDRFRDATRAVGETITDVPPLSLGARTKRVWLVPLAAAASVAVAVAAGTMIAKGGGNGISQVAASSAGPVAPPRFFADLGPDGITVRSVDSGATTATVPQPSTQERFTFLDAAQDNRLFFAASDTGDCHPRFYQFTLDENGQVTGFGVLSFAPADKTRPTSFAVSGDGTKLAYGSSACELGKAPSGLVVTDASTGESRTWTTEDKFMVADVTLSADGSKAAYQLLPAYPVTVVDASPAAIPTVIGSPDVPVTPSVNESVLPTPVAAGEAGAVATLSAAPSAGVDGDVPPVISVQSCANTTALIRPEPQPSGAVSPGVPEELPTEVPAALPSDVPPGSGEPSAMASAQAGGGDVAYSSVVSFCLESSEVWLLDTTGAGGTLGEARKLTLPTSYDGVSGGVMGVRLSPDGTRLIGSLGFVGMRIVDNKPEPVKGAAALVAFSATDGKPIETIYKDTDKGGMMLLDLDGSGQNALVRRMNEIGVVSASGYRTIRAAQEISAPAPEPRDGANVTWAISNVGMGGIW